MDDRHRDKNEDEELFVREMEQVKRIRHRLAERSSERPISAQKGNTRQEISPDLHDMERFVRPGIQQFALRRLRRSHIADTAMLDLHGCNTAEARKALAEFILQSQLEGKKTIRVIHGKGHGSAGSQPVLKAKVRQWLKEFPAVLAYCSARPENGGAGAVDVLLK
jgi:DNA-nicking Smr family endonuclease